MLYIHAKYLSVLGQSKLNSKVVQMRSRQLRWLQLDRCYSAPARVGVSESPQNLVSSVDRLTSTGFVIRAERVLRG